MVFVRMDNFVERNFDLISSNFIRLHCVCWHTWLRRITRRLCYAWIEVDFHHPLHSSSQSPYVTHDIQQHWQSVWLDMPQPHAPNWQSSRVEKSMKSLLHPKWIYVIVSVCGSVEYISSKTRLNAFVIFISIVAFEIAQNNEISFRRDGGMGTWWKTR